VVIRQRAWATGWTLDNAPEGIALMAGQAGVDLLDARAARFA
jgi:hypothetical protein